MILNDFVKSRGKSDDGVKCTVGKYNMKRKAKSTLDASGYATFTYFITPHFTKATMAPRRGEASQTQNGNRRRREVSDSEEDSDEGEYDNAATQGGQSDTVSTLHLFLEGSAYGGRR